MITAGSLFSGIGGLDLGLERAGMEIIWQCEKDPYCMKVLEKHWPQVRRYTDVKEIGEGAEQVDLICGGFPCQPVSIAGKRKGSGDARWLWPEFARVVRCLRPRYVLVENVTGLLSCGMGQVLGDLSGIGYDAEWKVIPAAAFGAPHLRYRVFIVAYPSGEGLEGSGEPEVIFAESPGDVGYWKVEPGVGRVVNGFPGRMDRLRTLGNAVVPQVSEWVGRQILNYELRKIRL